ncbi:MAG TPA: hypothetical protein VIV61_13375 [Candidatus Ozemobacteraceae bacterium]
MRRKFARRLRLLALLPVLAVALGQSPMICFAQDESLEDAKLLYKQAVDLKATGKADEAIATYEKAIRMNRGILSEDDKGLIGLLRSKYEKKLESSPDDLDALEGMGFVQAVCYADMAKAIACYEKVLALAKEERVKTKTANLLERLKAMQEATQRQSDEITAQMREERLKGWSEMEKQERLAAQHEESQDRATRYAQATQRREQLDTRIPQLEEEIKNLEEEYNKANRLWYTLKDSRYDRRRDRFEKDLEEKRRELTKAKSDFERVTADIEKMEKEMPADGSQSGAATATAQPDIGEQPPTSGETPADPALPAGDNPDFPPQNPPTGGDTGGEPAGGGNTGNGNDGTEAPHPAASGM